MQHPNSACVGAYHSTSHQNESSQLLLPIVQWSFKRNCCFVKSFPCVLACYLCLGLSTFVATPPCVTNVQTLMQFSNCASIALDWMGISTPEVSYSVMVCRVVPGNECTDDTTAVPRFTASVMYPNEDYSITVRTMITLENKLCVSQDGCTTNSAIGRSVLPGTLVKVCSLCILQETLLNTPTCSLNARTIM